MRLFGLDDTTTTDDWYTPAWVFDGLDVTFDLDVAAPEGGVPWVPAARHFTESDDGLGQSWDGVVWCNPPYSSPAAWCRRWADHPDGLILLRADLSTGGPHAALNAAHALWFPSKRLQFVNGRGGLSGACTFSTVLLARGQVCTAGLYSLAAKFGA